MARRQNQNGEDAAPGHLAGGVCASRSEAGDRRREKENFEIQCEFEDMSVNPREIELLCHYLSAEIDALLRDEG
jgi:hypothetical protein